MKYISFLMIFLLPMLKADAQPPDTLWTRTYGGEFHDVFYSVTVTPDNGFLLVGQKFSGAVLDSSDGWVVKTDSLGNLEWSRTFGGPNYDVIYAACNAPDGGFIIPVALYVEGRFSDLWLCKLDADGDTVWTRRYGGEHTDWPRGVRITPSGDIFVAGSTRSFGAQTYDMWLMKCTADGDSLWSRTYGGPNWDDCWAFDLTNDGGIIMAGYMTVSGSYDAWLLKTNSDGDSLWSHTYGGGGMEEARAIALAPDGGFLLAGYESSFGPSWNNGWLQKTDSLGNPQWTQIIGGGTEEEYWLEAILPETDGGCLAAGIAVPGMGGTALWLVRLDSLGDSLWTHRWFHQDISDAFDMQRLSNGGFVLAGESGYQQTWDTGEGWLIRMSPEPNEASDPYPTIPTAFSVSLYPNPLNSTATIRLTLPQASPMSIGVYDLLGRLVMNYPVSVLSAGEHTVPFAAESLPSGSYWLRAASASRSISTKVIILR